MRQMYIDKLGLYAVRSHLQILVMSVQVNASEPKGGGGTGASLTPELCGHPNKLRAACFIYLPPAGLYISLYYTTIFALALQHTPVARTD